MTDERKPIRGPVLQDILIPARSYAAFSVYRTNICRVIDVEGQQCADFVCFSMADYGEKLSNGNSMTLNLAANFTVGHILYSNECNPLFKIVADTSGTNYPGATMCSEEMNRARYGIPGTLSCRGNLTEALRPWGIGKRDLPGAFTPFMNVEVLPDGGRKFVEPISGAGDYVDLEAQMDVLVGISACPQDRNPVNAWNPTSLRVQVYHPEPEAGS